MPFGFRTRVGPRNLVLDGVQIAPWEERFFLGERTCPTALCHKVCRNGWTDQGAVWVVDPGGSKEACIRWRAHWRYLANTTEMSICVCDVAFVSNDSDHLLYLVVNGANVTRSTTFNVFSQLSVPKWFQVVNSTPEPLWIAGDARCRSHHPTQLLKHWMEIEAATPAVENLILFLLHRPTSQGRDAASRTPAL